MTPSIRQTTSRPIQRAACLCLCALSGCTVGPDYRRASTPVPPAFKELAGWKQAAPADSAPKGNWWEAFNDPLLNTLEVQVNVSNQTLRADEANFREALALVDAARAALYPTVSVTASDKRNSNGSGNLSSTTTSAGFAGRSSTVTRTQYSLEGNASWTIDVWGAIRRQIESNLASAQASAATLANARLSMQAMLATDYLDLRVTDALQRVLDDTVANDDRALKITLNQYNAGFAARSDVLTAQTQLEAAQSAAVNVGVARAQYEHAIAVLTGQPPAALSIAVVPTVPAVPDTPVVVPAALLERRPDIAQAERTVKAENALIGVAIAAYYPTIDLTALFGYAGDPVDSLIKVGNRVWSLGVSGTETLFNGGARTAQVLEARANYDASVATYRQTVLTAFQQVEDALSGLRILAQQDAIQQHVVRDATRAAEIALNEYRAGTQAYTAVITAQNTLLSARQTEVSIEQMRLTDAVSLIQALGGGWRPVDLPPPRSPLLP